MAKKKKGKKKGRLVLSRKKAMILFGAVIGVALIAWIALMIKIFGGKEKGGSLGNKTDKSGLIKFDARTDHCVKKYTVEGDKRTLVECTEYDKKDNLIKRTVIREGYPNEIYIYQYTKSGLQESGTYQFGNTKGSFSVTYDKSGRKKSQEWKDYPVKEGFLTTGTELYEYDSNGNLILDDKKVKHTNRSTGVKQLDYVTYTKEFDLNNNRIVLDKTETSDAERVTEMESHEYTYWDNGKLLTRIDRKVGYENFKEYYRLETYYDQNGREEHSERYEHDQLTRRTETHKDRTSIYYIDSYGEQAIGYRTESYDDYGRLLRKEEKEGGSMRYEQYSYDEVGRLTLEKHYAGYLYDDMADYYANMTGTSVKYFYEGPNGECTEELHIRKGYDYLVDRDNEFTEQKITFEYDDKGHMITKTVAHRDLKDVEAWTWEFNAKGNVIKETYTGKYNTIFEWEYE